MPGRRSMSLPVDTQVPIVLGLTWRRRSTAVIQPASPTTVRTSHATRRGCTARDSAGPHRTNLWTEAAHDVRQTAEIDPRPADYYSPSAFTHAGDMGLNASSA